MICGKIVPRQQEIVGDWDGKYLAECILLSHHSGHHVIKTPEGKYFAWEDDSGCNCEDCQTDEPDKWCYIYWELSQEEIKAIL